MYYDDKADAKLGGKVKDPIVKAVKWVKSRSQKEKGIMGCAGAAFVSGPDAPPYTIHYIRDIGKGSVSSNNASSTSPPGSSSLTCAGRLELARMG